MIKCNECDAACCRSMGIVLEVPNKVSDFEDLRWYVAHKDIHIGKSHDNKWALYFKADCEHITDDNKCAIYEHKPPICTEHDYKSCIKNGSDRPEKFKYETVEQIDELIKKFKNKSLKKILMKRRKKNEVSKD